MFTAGAFPFPALSTAYHTARSAEIRNRLITYLPTPAPVALLLRAPTFRFLRGVRLGLWRAHTGGFVRVPLVHFTLRHRAELSLTENALLTARPPEAADVFQFLWRLHPWFMRPGSILANQGHRRATASEARHARRIRARLIRTVAALDIPLAVLVLRAWLSIAWQDEPSADYDLSAGESGHAAPDRAPPVNIIDDYCDYFLRSYGLTRADVLDSPQAWLFQLHRNRTLAEPDGADRVIDPSSALLSS